MIMLNTPVFRYVLDSLQQALLALRDNWLRTSLSVLGVAAGVAAVLIIGTLTKGGREHVFAELETYGLNSIWIYRDTKNEDPREVMRPGTGITTDDLVAMAQGDCCPAVMRIAPMIYNWNAWDMSIRAGNNTMRARVEGADTLYFPISREEISMGRLFSSVDIGQHKNVVIIGSKVQEKLFGAFNNPVGENIRMGDIKLTVIGVLKEKNRTFLMNIGAESFNANERIILPFTFFQKLLGSNDVQTLLAEAHDAASVKIGSQQLVGFLERQHNKKYSYVVLDMLKWIDTAHEYLRMISIFGILAAAVSLIVGGIGIMNIMSTSVVERTREIGIRKAIGARRKDILLQFLLEAVFVSVIGGVMGLVGGTFITVVIGAWFEVALWPSFFISLGSILVAALVGILSGYYPARSAADMRPVDALRYE